MKAQTAKSVSLVKVVRCVTWDDFGPFLQGVRLQEGLSQAQLAEILGIDRTYVWRLEHGRNRPSRVLLQSLRRSFRFSHSDEELLTAFLLMREYHCAQLEPDV